MEWVLFNEESKSTLQAANRFEIIFREPEWYVALFYLLRFDKKVSRFDFMTVFLLWGLVKENNLYMFGW